MSVSWGLKTRYRTEIETKRKIRMLLATAFLPVPQVDTGWHNRFNKKVGGNKLGLYRLLHYLEEEQGVMEMLINQLLSRNSAAGSIRQISSRYAEKQQRFMIYTDEYTSGRRRIYNLFHQSKVYPVKHTNIEDKQWVFRQIEKGCRGSIHTNLDVDAVLSSDPHADDCTPDKDILYKMEKKNSLERWAAEELKTIPQIYHEKASRVSADLETAGQFPTYKCVKTAMCTGKGGGNFRDFRQLASSL
ncbi:hypothetical protein T12_16355 [Trichinella patagoniensis]|uniref:Uncharacterized protein n=1 Tax=Trichinella patagoniensis TaxID=990121 RepID=A0A0V0Z8S5_9BILA|nr:hypothetical protein T12_16355 [Trichinella patagoniensis]